MQYQFQFRFYCSRYGRSKKVRYVYPRIAAFCDVKNPGGEFFTLAGMLTQAKGNFPSFMRLSTSNSFSQVLGSATSAKIFQMTSAFTYIEQRGQIRKYGVSKQFLKQERFKPGFHPIIFSENSNYWRESLLKAKHCWGGSSNLLFSKVC